MYWLSFRDSFCNLFLPDDSFEPFESCFSLSGVFSLMRSDLLFPTSSSSFSDSC